MGQLLKLTLVSKVLPLPPPHTEPGCMFLASHFWVHSHAHLMLPEGIPES